MKTVLSVVHGNMFGGPHNRNTFVGRFLEVRHGIRTIVLVPDEPGNAVGRIRRQGISVVKAPVERLRAKLDPRFHWRFLSGFHGTVKRMQAVIREQGVDLVQINGVSNPHAAVAARREGVPVVWQILDTFPPQFFLWAMMPYVCRTTAALMSTGKRVAAAHPGALSFGERLVYFYPPVDIARFSWNSETAQQARKELGLPSGVPVVGNVSNFNPQKGHGTFIRAAARLKQARPEARFVILGKVYDAHRTHFESLMAEARALGLRVGDDLIVRNPEDRVAELAMAFDVFVMTSEPRSEGIPTVVEEAMALGLPVVSTDVGSVNEAVADGTTGRLVSCRDDRAVARAVGQMIADLDVARSMGEQGRTFARRHFSVEQCAAKHLQAYSIALGQDLVETCEPA